MVHASTTASAASTSQDAQGIRSGALRSVVVVGGVVACIGAAIPAIPFLVSARGVAGPTIVDAAHPAQAVVATLAVLIGCTAVGCVVGKLLNAAVGLFVLGCGVAMLSMRTGTVMDVAFDGDTLRPIALETLAWAGAVAAMSIVVFRVSGPLPDIPPMQERGPFVHEVVNADALRGLLTGLVAIGVVWLLMRNDLKGQAVGSSVLAGVAVALAGRKLQGLSQPILLMAAPVLGIGAAQLWSALAMGSATPLDQLVAGNALPGWSRIMPLDAAAGALIGVPVGLGWSRSTTEE
jgi:hypothetical protein